MPAEKKRIILIGGAFDPPTLDGHGNIIRHVMNTFKDYKPYISLTPSANGPSVLGKELKTSGEHRYKMTCMLANALKEQDTHSTELSVNAFEMELSDITGMPSYTANTLILLRHGLIGLFNKPENLLTPQEKELSDEEQNALIQARKTQILTFLTNNPEHPYLTANGILQPEDEIIAVYGADALTSLHNWYDVPTLSEMLTQFYFVPRADVDLEATKERLALDYPELTQKITIANTIEDASRYASSTRLRQAISSQYVIAGQLAEAPLPGPEEAEDTLSQSLLPSIGQYIQDNQLYSNFVTRFVTDMEGNWDYYYESLQKANELIEHLKESNQIDRAADTITVCGGDLPNKGKHDLRITLDIKNRVEQGEQWLLISGNRDDNSIRFLELLNLDYIDNFLNKSGPFWVPGNRQKTPKDYCADKKIENYQQLDIQSKRVIVLQWMLEHTMGSPRAFEYRRSELTEILGYNPTDSMIMQSFLEEILKPEEFLSLNMGPAILPSEYQGIRRWYMENSQLLGVLGNGEKNTIYSHNGIPEGVYPHLQNGEKITSGFYDWVNAYNAERRLILDDYIQQAINNKINGIVSHRAVLSSLPRDVTGQSGCRNALQSYDSFKDKQAHGLLLGHNIYTSVHGHQIVLTYMPLVERIGDFVRVNTDTRAGNQAQYPTGTVVTHDGTLYSMGGDPAFFINTKNPLIGQSFTLNGHSYCVNAQPWGEDFNYICICREKKSGAPFFSVDSEYGQIVITQQMLEKLLAAETQQRNSFFHSSSSENPEEKEDPHANKKQRPN